MPATNSAPILLRSHSRRGLTLVEMLVSLACVILLMLAYTQLFAEAGARINDARGAIELTNRLRSAAQQLRNDFSGMTAEMLPWSRPEAGAGYFEIVEGRLRDLRSDDDYVTTPDVDESSFPIGDVDDWLFMTVRKKNGNFTGKFWMDSNNDGVFQTSELQAVQSEVAEVVWFLRPTMQPDPANPSGPAIPVSPPTYTLYRKAFLVMPSYTGGFPGIPAPTTQLKLPPVANPLTPPKLSFYDQYDVSARYDRASGRYVANTLADLTKRECRYGHIVDTDFAHFGYPHPINEYWLAPFGISFIRANPPTPYRYDVNTTHPRYGEDVVLTNVLAFDIQVWDPTAPNYIVPNNIVGTAPSQVTVSPGDPGFNPTPTGSPRVFPLADSLGAYVDLNWWRVPYGSIAGVQYPPNAVPMSPFYSAGDPKSALVANFTASPNFTPAVFDSWSFHYEHDGLDQDGNGVTDQGTDGFDNNGTFGVDDPIERETSPPYPVPLRGIKVRLRVYEPDTRQIREVSVEHSFVPE
ncbi:MAG: type II secretion system protein [Pirellulales bacterium]|nr:type II secretion system protein [Pirellulales bacterium]